MGQQAKPSEQLLSLMASRTPAVRQSQLARDMGITATSIGRYMKQMDNDTIDDHVWARMAEILRRKYAIEADSVRPVRKPLTVDDSLTPHLEAFKTKEQLEALIKILEGSDKQQARDLLIVIARDRLARR